MNESKKELIRARKLYKSKMYSESLEIYEKYYKTAPQVFNSRFKKNYAWAIYQVHIKKSRNLDELVEYVNFVTELISQGNLNKIDVCPYVLSVFRILDVLYYSQNYSDMFYWLDKLNPDLLESQQCLTKERPIRSKKEKYYDYLSKAYFKCGDYNKCIEVSKTALNTFEVFTSSGDAWHNFRIAKSYKQFNQYEKAFIYLNKVIKIERPWFVHKELAEVCFKLNNVECCLMHIREAILKDESAKTKINLYYLVYDVLKESNPELANKHLEFYQCLRDNTVTNLEDEINQFWLNK